MLNLVSEIQPVSSISNDQLRRLRPLESKESGTLIVHEIYRSVQGESLYAGLPCVFVRLTACHLRCVYCDTPHAFQHGLPLTLDQIVERIDLLADPLVEITGGEPLLQAEAFTLMSRLADLGKTVLLETSGAVAITEVDRRVHIILDVKTPGSGEVAANLAENYPRLKPDDEVKYVLCDQADFEWSVDHVRTHGLLDICPVLFSPAHGQVDPRQLADWILQTRLPIRLQLQMHKQLWNPNARGV